MRPSPTQLAVLEVLSDRDHWVNLSYPGYGRRVAGTPTVLQALRGTAAKPTWRTAEVMADRGLVRFGYVRGFHGLRDFIRLRITTEGQKAFLEATR